MVYTEWQDSNSAAKYRLRYFGHTDLAHRPKSCAAGGEIPALLLGVQHCPLLGDFLISGSCPISLQSSVYPKKDKLQCLIQNWAPLSFLKFAQLLCLFLFQGSFVFLSEIWGCRDSFEGLLFLQASIGSSKSNKSSNNNPCHWLSRESTVRTYSARALLHYLTTAPWVWSPFSPQRR